MTALYIILGIIAFFIIVLSIPVVLDLEYTDAVRCKVSWLFLKFTLYPFPEKKKKEKKPKEEKKEEKPEEKKEEKPYLLLLGVMCLGLMIYYINRPVEGSLFIVLFLMLILQTVILQKSQNIYLEWKDTREHLFDKPH